MLACRHTGIHPIRQDKHIVGRWRISANQASRESARQVCVFGRLGFKRGADLKVLRVRRRVKATRTKLPPPLLFQAVD